MAFPYLSIIIPAHNEARRLPGTLTQVFDFLQQQPYQAEVIVVENASSDDTLRVAQDFAHDCPQCRVLCETQRGKGLAVRAGMLAARGAYRFMCDADLSMPVAEISHFLPPALADFDVAIASREAPGAVRFNEPAYRHWGGRGINLIIRLLALPGLHDTQCGFKMFRAAVAEDLFRHQTITNWSFDIELLYLARLRRYHIREVPISWYFDAETKLNPLRDALQMVRDILHIHRNARRGIYDPQD